MPENSVKYISITFLMQFLGQKIVVFKMQRQDQESATKSEDWHGEKSRNKYVNRNIW